MARGLLGAKLAAFRLSLGMPVSISHGHAAGAQDAATPRKPKDAAEFDHMYQQVSNWGRWGKDDQFGTANLLTAASRKQAAGLVKQGISVSLNHDGMTEVAADNPSPWEHTMNRGFSTDTYKVSYHGYAHSHMDALCHYSYRNQTYNG